MTKPQAPPPNRWPTVLLGIAALSFVACLIIVPDQAFQSSLAGLQLWWKFVFPALLPFLIVSELLTGLGAVDALGVLLGPLMRVLFRVPAAGGRAAAAGIAAGFPAGADATARLAAQGLLSRPQAERLLAVSHAASPALPVAFAGAGLLRDAGLGVGIAAVHAAAALLAGLLLRFWGGREAAPRSAAVPAQARSGVPRRQAPPAGARRLLARAAAAMREAHAADGRAFGKLLGDAVGDAVQRLMMIGGYMIFFSVMTKMTSLLLASLPASAAFAAILAGLLEPHLGVLAAIQHAGTPQAAAAWIGAALGWSGLSLHAQVRTLTAGAGLRYFPFFLARCLHAALAAGMTVLFREPIARLSDSVRPVFLQGDTVQPFSAPLPLLPRIGVWLAYPALVLAAFLVLALAASLFAARLTRNH